MPRKPQNCGDKIIEYVKEYPYRITWHAGIT